MRKLFTLLAAGALVLGTAATATAANLPVTATLSVAIGTLPPAAFTGGAASASSAGNGGAATLPADSISDVFLTAVDPPLVGVLNGIGIGGPGLPLNSAFTLGVTPAANNPLDWEGATGTMALNGSSYLLMDGVIVAEIPLAVVGVGGTQMFHVLTLVTGVINANPYQLGMLTLMGSLNTTPHTLMATGADNRTAGGGGSLVLVSPTNVDLGTLGALASLSTLTLNFEAPEPNALLLMGAAVATLVAIGRKKLA